MAKSVPDEEKEIEDMLSEAKISSQEDDDVMEKPEVVCCSHLCQQAINLWSRSGKGRPRAC